MARAHRCGERGVKPGAPARSSRTETSRTASSVSPSELESVGPDPVSATTTRNIVASKAHAAGAADRRSTRRGSDICCETSTDIIAAPKNILSTRRHGGRVSDTGRPDRRKARIRKDTIYCRRLDERRYARGPNPCPPSPSLAEAEPAVGNRPLGRHGPAASDRPAASHARTPPRASRSARVGTPLSQVVRTSAVAAFHVCQPSRQKKSSDLTFPRS